MSDEQTAMLKIDDKTVGIWFLSTMEAQDWMCTLREVVADEQYEITYRFRYYKDDKAFDSADERSWYKAVAKGTRNYCIGAVRLVATSLSKTSEGNRVYEYINDQGLEEFMERFQDAPFVFMRMEKKAKES